MTAEAREYAKQWVSPGVIMGVLGWLVLLGGAWVRLSSLEAKFVELSSDVKAATVANQDAAKEFIRLQGKVERLTTEIEDLRRGTKLLDHELTKVKVALVAKGVIRPSDV